MDDLHTQMMAAHADRDLRVLVELYSQAADAAETGDAEGFFLTHAYIFALEIDSPLAPTLHARLKAAGREE